jgi:predicted protein tyrosine phosphatase
VISILDPGASPPPELADLAAEERLELRFHDVIDDQAGMQCPRREDMQLLLHFVLGMSLREGRCRHLLTHCHAGFSRSAAAAMLVLAATCPRLSSEELNRELLRLRRWIWPNLRMIELGDELLNQRGALVAAVSSLYGILLKRDPSLHQLMQRVGRGRELAIAAR